MDVTHILLGRSWQFDVNTTHHGRHNQYIIKVDDCRSALMPLPANDKETNVDKPNLIIQSRNQFYCNLNVEMQG